MKTKQSFLLGLVGAPLLCVAQTNAQMLPEIVVYGEQNQSLTSSHVVDQETMQKTPVSNGNITDYLRNQAGIRFENSDQNGFQRGEIKPDHISIHGADVNQTAYFVDNVNVNNDLTVDSEVFDGAMQVVPGINHTQGYFFDAEMLSKVDVQDHNISASLGGFMGGAVIAKTKQYNGKDGVQLKYRTTGSNLAKMHVDSSAQQVLKKVRPEADGTALLQPQYKKQHLSLLVEKGLTENLGLVFGVSQRTSKIAQHRLIGFGKDAHFDKQDHLRKSNNLLLNINWTPTDTDRIELSTRYSNYTEQKYYAQNIDSNVKDKHQAYGFTLGWVKAFESGVWSNNLAYDKFQDKRYSSSANVEIVSALDEDTFDPLYDYEKGGYGNSALTQRNLHFSTEYAFNPIDFAGINHNISVGGIYQNTQYHFDRPQDVNSTVITKLGDMDLDNTSSTTAKGSAKVNYQNIALYAENLMRWRNLEWRLGLRVERDDYLKNTNIAPRFVFHYKPWDDTQLSVGLNRYYGRSFASLKLTDKILQINQDTSRNYQQFKQLKTPYADELSLGIEQKWQNLVFKLNYVHRQNKNRILLKREDGNNIYRNGKPFAVDSYALQIRTDKPWQLGNTYWNASFSFDWLDTKRADLHRDLDPQELVMLDGKLMSRQAMQRKVNSSTEDWIARIGLDMAVPALNLTWSNNLALKAPIRSYEEIDSPDDLSRFRTVDYGKHFQWDTRFRWQPKLLEKHSVYLQVDILNVLNKTRKIRSARPISSQTEYGVYTPGREFWLEVGYQF